MGLIINSFSDGWQNKARRELMKDSALYMCEDLTLDEIGSLGCRYKHTEDSYFANQTLAGKIRDLLVFYVEGLDHKLVYYRIGTTLYCWNSYTEYTRTVSISMTKEHITGAMLRPELSENSHIYITDGLTMFSDSGSADYAWGIDPPDNLPLVSMAGSGGNLSAGGYSYRYTFYDNDTGAESDPSVVSATTTASANDLATISHIQVSSNPRVTSRKLYRTLANGGVWYLVTTLNDNVTTEIEDSKLDANLTTELNTDQGIPPYGDVVVAYKNRLFLTGNTDYPNRVWYSDSDSPDNWDSLNYLEVGTTNSRIMNIVEFEGKLYFIQTDGICGLYGSDENTFAWHKTRSHVGVSARWSCSAGPDGIYFMSHDGVYRFDGLKSIRISESIDRTFGIKPDIWTEIVDQETANATTRGDFLLGVYYLLVPMSDSTGIVTNRLLTYDTFSQVWTKYLFDGSCLCTDARKGKILAGRLRFSAFHYTIYELMNSINIHDNTAHPRFVTKTYTIANTEDSNSVGWLRRFRVDCIGAWTLRFYVDGLLVYTKILTNQTAHTRYQWYSFEPQIKGRYMFVYAEAPQGSTTYEDVFYEMEVT